MTTQIELYRVDSLDPTESFQEKKAPGSTERTASPASSSTLPSNNFHYTPLDDHSRQIRLCHISPLSAGTDMVVLIENHNLDSVVGRFIALSYAWGDISSKIPISVNGCRFDITTNLHTQICRLCALGCERRIWIDSLCINQSDQPERMAQVSMMKDIFSGAEEVLIGLDEETKDLHRAAADHALVAAAIKAMADGTHLSHLALSRQPAMAPECESVDRLLIRVFRSAWLQRVWVIQEICLARRATVLLSQGSLPWATFTRAFQEWNEHRKATCCSQFVAGLDQQLKEGFHRVYCHIANINHSKAAIVQGQHILGAMLCFQHLDVTVPVDKFNGYRGLHTSGTLLPPPDYSRPTAQVFEDIAVWLLEDRRCLMPLVLELKGEEAAGFASWVPDFSRRPPIEQNYWRGRLLFYEAYKLQLSLDWAFEHNLPGQLCLYGIEVDQVSLVAPAVFRLLDAADHIRLLKEWFFFATGRQASSLVSRDKQFDDDVFCATMLAGCVKDPGRTLGVRKADAADYAYWQHDLQTMEASSTDGRFHSPLMESHITAVLERALFKTKSGSLGIGPRSVKPGDSLWIFGGGNSPFVTRRKSSSTLTQDRHTLLGHCYHHWLMTDGSAVDTLGIRPSVCVLV